MEVYKLGGASVKDAESFRNITAILNNFTGKLLVVISAMGKTTNALEKVVNAWYFNRENTEKALMESYAYHMGIIEKLFPVKVHPVYEKVQNLFAELKKTVQGPVSGNFDKDYDSVVHYGEILSSVILNFYLNEKGLKNKWVDARQVIVTNSDHRQAVVKWDITQTKISNQVLPLFDLVDLVITQGFIGAGENGEIVTLGREGSDYTASIFAYCLGADKVTVWKDVPGVLDADPKYFTNTKIIETLSYADAVELAYYGASVIHPKTIKPLENKSIPLYVKSFINPAEPGTLISDKNPKQPLAAYIFKENQALVSIYPTDFSFIAECNMRDIFNILTENKITINLMQNTAVSFSLVFDYQEAKFNQVINHLGLHFRVKYNLGLELLTIRYYNKDITDKLLQHKEILMEQKSRQNAQFVIRNKSK